MSRKVAGPWPRFVGVFAGVVLGAFGLFVPGKLLGAVLPCGSGDVACLVKAIDKANTTQAPSTILLETGTYTLTGVNNTAPEGPNGLPVIVGQITIVGAGGSATVLQRDPLGPSCRIFQVAPLGRLKLESLTVQNGDLGANFNPSGGAAILNLGSLELTKTIVRNNALAAWGGAIRNQSALTILDSLIELNVGGGVWSEGTSGIGTHMLIVRSTLRLNRSKRAAALMNVEAPALISESTIHENVADPAEAAVEVDGGDTTFVNTTISGNQATGVVDIVGKLLLVNCTIADNQAAFAGSVGGIELRRGLNNVGERIAIQNTILARNTVFQTASDCGGDITSLGNNLVGTYSNCRIILFPSDRAGDPGLGVFTDQRPAASGAPYGIGHIPLLAGSQAIDAGEPSACTSLDQLGFPRADGDLNGVSTCDIGAMEFEPIVNSLVAMTRAQWVQARSPQKGAPAGTATLTARYSNTSSEQITRPVFVVRTIGGGAILLNRDAPSPSGVGARLTPDVGSDLIWAPGESIDVRFVLGLQEGRIPTFAVDLVGYPQ